MDSNRTAEDFYQAHPDWFARQRLRRAAIRADDKYVTCINSPYYDEYLPGVLQEIIERSHPEGFTDNSWSGLGRDSICYCDNCERKFRAAAGKALPARKDWDDPVYRQWIQWNYAAPPGDLGPEQPHDQGGGRPGLPLDRHEQRRRSPARAAPSATSRRSASAPRSCCSTTRRATTHGLPAERRHRQARARPARLGQADAGEHGACTRSGAHSFRLAAKPAAEARMWMIEGFAGGIQPWWHHIGAYHEDRRMYRTAEPYALARGERAVPGQPPARRHRRRGLVAAQHRLLRPRRRRRAGGRALPRHHGGAHPRAHPVPAGSRRPHRARRRDASRRWSCRTSARCRMRSAPRSGGSSRAAAA